MVSQLKQDVGRQTDTEQHPVRLERGVWTGNVIFKMVNKLRAGVV